MTKFRVQKFIKTNCAPKNNKLRAGEHAAAAFYIFEVFWFLHPLLLPRGITPDTLVFGFRCLKRFAHLLEMVQDEAQNHEGGIPPLYGIIGRKMKNLNQTPCSRRWHAKPGIGYHWYLPAASPNHAAAAARFHLLRA